MHRLYAAAAFVFIIWFSTVCAAGVRNVGVAPLAAGPFPVACSDVAYNAASVSQIGGSPADFWEGNPQNGRPRYFTDILLEPQDTIQINPIVPNDSSFYVQNSNTPVPFVVIVCYPTSTSNTRPDYPLADASVVPKMQRAGQKPIFPPLVPPPLLSGQDDPNFLPLLVLSHGLAGSPLNTDTLEIMNSLASFGYVVAAPFHGDARFSLIQISTIADLTSVLYNFDRFVEMEALRPLALKATVDAMLAHPDFGPRINPNKIGGFGASMGGASMTWLLGASVTDGFHSQNAHATVRDPRLKAVVGYVPFAGESFLPAFGVDNGTAINVNTPYLAICGTADIVAPRYRMEQAMSLFGNSHYMVALTGVPHGYDNSYAGDVLGWTIPFLNAYVNGDASALANFLQQKDVLGGLDDNVVIDYTAPAWGSLSPTLVLAPGWNLAGNGVETPIAVATNFNYPSTIATIWKWVTSGTAAGINYPAWAFYSPTQSDGGQAYAASKGYDFLTTINAGEGFWVNAKTAFTVPLASGTGVQSSSFTPALAATPGGRHALPHRWSLIAAGDSPTPTRFDASIATVQSAPPATGSTGVYTNLTTLWAWDAAQQRWYFWAPSLVNSGGLTSYIGNNNYLDFATMPSTPAGTLAPTTGFWVNMP